MRAIVLAAGEGVRLRPLTTYMPKVMLPVGNRPILEHIIIALKENNVRDITLVVGYHSNKVMQYFGDGSDFGVRISYALQRKQVGTVHALYQARMDDEFLLVYGDNMVSEECIGELIDTEVNTILGIRSNRPFRYGVIEKEGMSRIEIMEKPKIREESIIFTGMGHFDGKIFKLIREAMDRDIYNLPSVLNMLKVKLKVVACNWRDALYPWDLLDLNSMALEGITKKLAGKIEDATIIGNVEIGEGTRIGAGSYIRGNVRIGDNCDIGPNSVILGDTSIGDGVKIGAMGYVENSIIMEHSRFGVDAVIRDSVVGRDITAGDRVLIASGERTRIFMGEIMDVNGGAVIGDGALIGSGVVIGGGIVIGSNSRIAPLKSVTEDVANDESVR